jgi:hypothetical protein
MLNPVISQGHHELQNLLIDNIYVSDPFSIFLSCFQYFLMESNRIDQGLTHLMNQHFLLFVDTNNSHNNSEYGFCYNSWKQRNTCVRDSQLCFVEGGNWRLIQMNFPVFDKWFHTEYPISCAFRRSEQREQLFYPNRVTGSLSCRQGIIIFRKLRKDTAKFPQKR